MSDKNATPDFTSCPNWGKGGRYVVDAHGVRTAVIPEDGIATEEQVSAGTGVEMTPVSGDALEVPQAGAATDKSTRKGK